MTREWMVFFTPFQETPPGTGFMTRLLIAALKRLLRPGFGHVTLVCLDNDVVLDFRFGRLDAGTWGELGRAERQRLFSGHRVRVKSWVDKSAKTGDGAKVCFPAITCVGFVKRQLGIRAPVFTPWSLYRHLAGAENDKSSQYFRVDQAG